MPHVLLVDDNQELLDSIAFDLEMRGYQVTKTYSGNLALHFLTTHPTRPDIIVSDISMPDMNGFALLENVQRNTHWLDIPFIFLTAHDSPSDVRLGKQLGADDYLTKPIDVDDLAVAVENKLRRVAQWKLNSTQTQMDQMRRELAAIIQSRQSNLLSLIEAYSGSDSLLEELEAMPDEFSQKAMQAVRSMSNQASRLINQIVLLAKLDQGGIGALVQSQTCPISLRLIVETACQLLSQEFSHPNPLCQFEFPPNDLQVLGIWDLLTLLVSEVIRNGLIFSEGAVQIRIRTESNAAVLQISDQGIGIEPKYMPLIWDRFSQFCIMGRPQQGAGLGLSVVAEIIRLANGHVQLESKPGRGTLVTLRFPLVASA